ncbi:PqqD family protein [Actinoplanes sp. NPDC049668]|uniref:PqqD family protein n=1 Tax=unclassified Actinoplanes TaxID=2626549 RepID=UPI0033B278F2
MTGVSFTVSDSVVWAGDDTIRIYHVDAGQFQSLNGTGSSIWSLMASGMDTHQIARELTDRLAGGDPAAYRAIRGDVEHFLYGLAKQNMVIADTEKRADGRRAGSGRTDEDIPEGAGPVHR